MEGIRNIIRSYEQILTKELIDADPDVMASHYVFRLRNMIILVDWEDKPQALFDKESKRLSSLGDTRMAYAASQIDELEEVFCLLIKRSVYDRVAHRILSLVTIEHTEDRKSLPYIPQALRFWIMGVFEGYFPPPTNEEKRLKFLRNVKIVMLLETLTFRGIPPTRNPGTAPGQYGVDIIGELMNLSPDTIATIWKERVKYSNDPFDSWKDYRRLFNSDFVDRYKKTLADRGNSSRKNEDSTQRNLNENLPNPLSTHVVSWINDLY